MSDRLQGEGALVQFNERLTNSAAFGTLFREGMDLVEETAAYLDGVGRAEAKALDRAAEGFRRAQVPDGSAFGMFSCSKATNEMNYAAQKFTRSVMGSNNIDSCNRT